MTLLQDIQQHVGRFPRSLTAMAVGMACIMLPQIGFALDPAEAQTPTAQEGSSPDAAEEDKVFDPEAAYKAGNEAYRKNDWFGAMDHLRQSAAVQHVPSMLMLAYILDRAEEDVAAIGWYRKAAMMNSAEGALRLGLMLTRGAGVEKNETEGLEWITRSAKLNHYPAMMVLADTYKRGRMGVTANPEEANKWLEMAARGKFMPAIKALERARQKAMRDARARAALATTQPVTPPPRQDNPDEALALHAEVRAAIEQWARAWTEKNEAAYLSAYASDVQPSVALDPEDTTLQIALDQLKIILLERDKAHVVLNQSQHTNGRQQRAKRVLSLQKEDGGWKIVREETSPQM